MNKSSIRKHYNLATPFYWLLWGSHIHHGLWNGDESASRAQLNLTETLAAAARIQPGERVLDVGCGMGGSAIHLARKLGCDVLGLTLSPLQKRWASCSARLRGAAGRARFQCADVEQVGFDANSFDVIWSIECTEHLFDKAGFFRRTADWLRPGGRLAICAWLAGDGATSAANHRQIVWDVCDGFFCPSLGSRRDYERWISDAGLAIERSDDWTSRVAKTWEICLRRARRTGIATLGRLLGRDARIFLDRFETILTAYRTGAMQYGCLVASKPL